MFGKRFPFNCVSQRVGSSFGANVDHRSQSFPFNCVSQRVGSEEGYHFQTDLIKEFPFNCVSQRVGSMGLLRFLNSRSKERFHSTVFPSEWEDNKYSSRRFLSVWFPFNCVSQRVGRVRSSALTQSGFQTPNRHTCQKSNISSQKLSKTHTSNPFPVRHRHTSTEDIGFQRFAEVCRCPSRHSRNATMNRTAIQKQTACRASSREQF